MFVLLAIVLLLLLPSPWNLVGFACCLVLFLGVGLLSIYPTIRFLKWRAQTRQGLAPVLAANECRSILAILRIELLLLLATVLCASLMARGVGS